MPRPQAFTDDQLLAAAREVFLERGVLATSAEVAARAGVAEGTLFYRFKTKAALFQAALRADMEEPHWLQGLEQRVGHPDLPTTLYELGLDILAHFRKAVPLLMMQWSNPPPSRASAPSPPPEQVPARAVRQLAAFFEAEMHAGRLRERDAEVTARVFLGGFLHFAFHEALAPDARAPHLPSEPYVRQVVDLLLEGLTPTAARKASTRSAPRAPRRTRT
jgi:AcrR family transcriptional regulator